ncbi:CUB domain-containing protein-like [Hydractinia symbiolongicarpus]|uniref:CUB domain-containing protein-like n=1 Tax=Hydractinia symbiolongicarpus TaxID=13093 RepID=UPI00254D54B8|nr:CUB domain-containing protein-like [Hydractinia symbiolongicarpus]
MSLTVFVLMVIFANTYRCSGKVTSQFCFQCSSPNERGCIFTQKRMKCYGKEDTCITMSYSFKKMTKEGKKKISVFRKSCFNSQWDCRSFCDSFEETGDDECKATCCHGNLCNHGRKRSKLTSRASSHPSMLSIILLVISTVNVQWITQVLMNI